MTGTNSVQPEHFTRQEEAGHPLGALGIEQKILDRPRAQGKHVLHGFIGLEQVLTPLQWPVTADNSLQFVHFVGAEAGGQA